MGGSVKMRWSLNGSGNFDVQSYHKAICGINDHSFPLTSVVKMKVFRV